MKKRTIWFSTILTAVLLLSVIPFFVGSVSADNSCGVGLTWKIEGNTLTITGESGGIGTMDDFSMTDPAPWSDKASAIEKIIIANDVISIGKNAFCDFTNLSSVEFSNDLQTIGSYSFMGCSKLTSITLTPNITTIELCAFLGCTALSEIKNIDNVDNIQGGAFLGTAWLTNTKDKDGLVILNKKLIDGQSASGKLTVPNTVTQINDFAFQGATITDIEIPGSVKTIGQKAFEVCTNLQAVSFSGTGLTSLGISAFSGCTALNNIALPNTLSTINAYVFSDCTALHNITLPDNLTTIEPFAFLGCSSLQSIIIPRSVTTIGEKAIGYSGTADNNSIADFTIFGYSNSDQAVLDYCTTNGIGYVTIDKLKGLKLVSMPTKKNYLIGDAFDSRGMVINAYDSIGNETAIKDYTVDFDSSSVGAKTVKIKYKNFETTFTVTVTYQLQITPPKKTTYFAGDNLNTTGLIVKVKYNNSKITQTKNYKLTGYNKNKVGKQTITVSYTEGGITKKATFTVTVNNIVVSKITVKTKHPNYYVGDSFKPASISVTAKYNNNTTKSINIRSCSVKGYNLKKAGTQKVTVTYSKKTASFNIKVKALSTPKVKSVKSPQKGKAVITWKKTAGAKGYFIYRKQGKGKWKKIGKLSSASQVKFTDKKAPKGKKCFYTVQAYNGNAVGKYNKAGRGLKIKK